jgi:hypothetical protein
MFDLHIVLATLHGRFTITSIEQDRSKLVTPNTIFSVALRAGALHDKVYLPNSVTHRNHTHVFEQCVDMCW